ncbi:MAG: phosphotransferase [Lachnospiraceae bacterium]|nr:phosphotransferase [Lachnospiraceae bacterium]
MILEDVFCKYIKNKIISACPLGDGHINDTFLADTADGRYVVQRVKSTMDIESCLYNYGLYSKVCDEADWFYPVWIRNDEGKFFYTDETGCHWRVYKYIDGEIPAVPTDEDTLYACGQGLAKMHKIFAGIKETPKAVYPHLHDLKTYYDVYLDTLASKEKCEELRDPAIEKIIDVRVEAMLGIKPDSLSVVHGDAKLANILFKDGKVIGFIDFDTIMTGSVLEDIADCIRSCCIENDVLNKKKADRLIKGYKSIMQDDQVIYMDKLPTIFEKICFELGLRYYTDAIAKEKVFKEKYPGYRLARAKSLFSILTFEMRVI